MKTLLLVLCLATTASAQTVPMQVVFVTYVGNSAHWTDPSVTGPQLIAQDNGFWHGPRGSFGAITLTGTTWPNWIDSTGSMAGGCSEGQINQDVIKVMGLVPQGTIRQIILPPGTPCNSTTNGTYKFGATCWTPTGSFIEHETGHALGLGHAWATSPSGDQEYGDYDVMGNGGHNNTIHVSSRQFLNVYSSTFQLATVTTSQDVTVQLADTMTPGIKGVTVPKSVQVVLAPGFTITVDHTMTAELRSGDYATFGIIIHSGPKGYLQTMDPTVSYNPWVLAVGKTYCDPQTPSLICITTVQQDATTATLHVAIGGSVPHTPSKLSHFTVTQ